MKIDGSKVKTTHGNPLSSFALGDCIRLVFDDSELFLGCVYIVAAAEERHRQAINLLSGTYRIEGLFVLEPNAKVVIE